MGNFSEEHLCFPEAFLGSRKGKDEGGPGCDVSCGLSSAQASEGSSCQSGTTVPLELEPGPGPCPLLAHKHRLDAIFLLRDTDGQTAFLFLDSNLNTSPALL